MTVSVIIPTYNGAHKLPTIIQALKHQTLQPEEIIIVIDGSTDNTISVIEDLKCDYERIKMIIQENSGRAAVRNRGAKEAVGDLLIFFDDDMVPIAECMLHHVTHHQSFPESILTGAQIDFGDKKRSEIQQYKSYLSKKWTEPLKRKKHISLNKEELFLTAANCSITKKLFFELGSFDERLTDAEDFDLAVRAYERKIPLYFSYDAFAWHNDEITAVSYIKRLRQYHNAHLVLKQLKPDLHGDLLQQSLTNTSKVKLIVFKFFAKRTCINWIENSSWKKIFPRTIRYKFYDIIITANGVFFPEKVRL